MMVSEFWRRNIFAESNVTGAMGAIKVQRKERAENMDKEEATSELTALKVSRKVAASSIEGSFPATFVGSQSAEISS